MDKPGKIGRLRWKERHLRVIKLAQFLMFKTDKDIPPQRRQILQTFVLRGNKLARTSPPTTTTTIPASIIFSSFAELYLCSFYTYHSQTWQVHLFPDVFFPVVAHVKSWNNHARVYWFVLSTGSWVIVLRQLWNRASHILAFSSMVSVGPEWVR